MIFKKKNPGTALLGGSGSGSLKRLQLSCWLAFQSLMPCMGPEGLFPKSLTHVLLQFFIMWCSWHGFPQCKWSRMEAAGFYKLPSEQHTLTSTVGLLVTQSNSGVMWDLTIHYVSTRSQSSLEVMSFGKWLSHHPSFSCLCIHWFVNIHQVPLMRQKLC